MNSCGNYFSEFSAVSTEDTHFINFTGGLPNFYIRIEDFERTEEWVNKLNVRWIIEIKPEWAWRGYL